MSETRQEQAVTPAVTSSAEPPAQAAKPSYFAFSRETGRTEIQPQKREAILAALDMDAEAIQMVPLSPPDKKVAGRVLGDTAGKLRGKNLTLRKQITSEEKIVHAVLRPGAGGAEATEVATLAWEPDKGMYCGSGDAGVPAVIEAIQQFNASRGMLTADDWAEQVRLALRTLDGFKARRDGRVYWAPEYSAGGLQALRRAVRAAGAELVIATCTEAELAQAVATDGLADQIDELEERPGGADHLADGVDEIVGRAERLGIKLDEASQARLGAMRMKAEGKRHRAGRAAAKKAAAQAITPAAVEATAAGSAVVMLELEGKLLELTYAGEAGGMHSYTVGGGIEAPVFTWKPHGAGHICGYAGRIFSSVKL